MICVGIDWADKSHSVCVLDQDGSRLAAFDVPHSQQGFEKAHAMILRHAPSTEVVGIAIETRDSLLVDFLSELGYTLYFLNPRQTDRFRDRHRMSHSKTDAFDAFVLADALRTDKEKFNSLSPLDQESLSLRVLCRTRKNLVQRKVAIHNELTACLKRYFPAALELFNGLDSPGAIHFLLQYPTYEQARTVSRARIAAILVKQGFRKDDAAKRAEIVKTKLAEPQPTPSANVAAVFPAAAKSLLRQMRDVLREIQDIEEQIKDLYRNHPNKTLIQSLPGIAETLGPVIAGELGAEITRYASLATLRAYAGTSPVTASSGKYRAIRFRRACNQHLRHAMHLAAQTAIRRCCWARKLYDRLKAAGKSHGRALRAVADQLIEMLYVILLRRTPYDEAYHLRMQTLHGAPVLT
jgi:transposase